MPEIVQGAPEVRQIDIRHSFLSGKRKCRHRVAGLHIGGGRRKWNVHVGQHRNPLPEIPAVHPAEVHTEYVAEVGGSDSSSVAYGISPAVEISCTEGLEHPRACVGRSGSSDSHEYLADP